MELFHIVQDRFDNLEVLFFRGPVIRPGEILKLGDDAGVTVRTTDLQFSLDKVGHQLLHRNQRDDLIRIKDENVIPISRLFDFVGPILVALGATVLLGRSEHDDQ